MSAAAIYSYLLYVNAYLTRLWNGIWLTDSFHAPVSIISPIHAVFLKSHKIQIPASKIYFPGLLFSLTLSNTFLVSFANMLPITWLFLYNRSALQAFIYFQLCCFSSSCDCLLGVQINHPSSISQTFIPSISSPFRWNGRNTSLLSQAGRKGVSSLPPYKHWIPGIVCIVPLPSLMLVNAF